MIGKENSRRRIERASKQSERVETISKVFDQQRTTH
jgi:hypothetical protein